MILRPLDLAPAGSEEFVDAWPVVERMQRKPYTSCWMITQPSHAALAGGIAAQLTGPQVPKLDASLIRAIELHDAGWGHADAEAIMHSRSSAGAAPKSFLAVDLPEFLTAWTQSIEITQKVSKAGGYMVSRHFWRLAEHRVVRGDDKPADLKKLQSFLNSESARQKKLMTGQTRTLDDLERLTDLLQFCDLLSLFICSGAQERGQLPECFGVKAKIVAQGTEYRLDPALVESEAQFSVAALRYPQTKEESSREILVKFGNLVIW